MKVRVRTVAILVLVLLSLAVREAFRPEPKQDPGSASDGKGAAAARPGMIYVPAGRVHLGASKERLREHAATLDHVVGAVGG